VPADTAILYVPHVPKTRLRSISEPLVVASPPGARVHTRLKVNQNDAEALQALGSHLGSLAGRDRRFVVQKESSPPNRARTRVASESVRQRRSPPPVGQVRSPAPLRMPGNVASATCSPNEGASEAGSSAFVSGSRYRSLSDRTSFGATRQEPSGSKSNDASRNWSNVSPGSSDRSPMPKCLSVAVAVVSRRLATI
jgi:hypothetical protein